MTASGGISAAAYRISSGVLLALLLLAALGLRADSATASPSLGSFSFRSLAADGSPATQAGAHSNVNAALTLATPGAPETARSLRIGAPPGFFIYPEATPRCSTAGFGQFECPPSTQVGLVTVRAKHEGNPDFLLGTAPVYMLAPGAGEFARLGFVMPTLNLPVAITATVRTETDFGLDLSIAGLTQLAPLSGIDLTLWAVPADPDHDGQRFPAGNPSAPAGCPGDDDTNCVGGPSPVALPETPMLRNPTACTGPQAAKLEADSYQQPGDYSSATYSTLASSGCNHLSFGPMLSAGLTTTETSAPSGLDFRLELSNEGGTNPVGLSASDVKALTAELPEGLAVDDEAADEQAACTIAQAHLGSAEAEECPADSKIGDFSAAVLGLDESLEGSIYFGGAESAGAYRLFLTAAGSGLDVKLLATLATDPDTEVATLSIAALPQIPFEEFDLSIDEEAGLLLTPAECGDFALRGTMTPWSSAATALIATASLSIESGPEGGPCPGPVDHVEVSLDPGSIPADGKSVTIATATLADANDYLFSGEEVTFSSSDVGQLIGPTIDNGDGTYSAEIRATGSVGQVTITATDESVDPEASGSAQLTQIEAHQPAQVIPPAEVPPPGPPVARLVSAPPHRTPDRTPTFRFAASTLGVSFRCKIDSHPYRGCRSPLTLAKLSFGPHTFRVRAVDATGTGSAPVTYRFTIPRPH